MSFKFSAAHSSRIKKPSKPPSFKRSSSAASPFSSLPRRKPIRRSSAKPDAPDADEDEDFFGDRLDDVGIVQALVADMSLRDVPQAIKYIRARMFDPIPDRAAGMNSTRIAEVLNFRASLPPLVTVFHIQALLDSPTSVEREIAELTRAGGIRKIVVPDRGGIGEALVLIHDLDSMIQASALQQDVKDQFLRLLHENPAAVKITRSQLSAEHARALMYAGFLTSSTSSWTATDIFTRPEDGSRGTMTSLNSISKAASGSMAAVGGEGAVHLSGGSGGGAKSLPGTGDFALALPAAGSLLRLLSNARTHLLSLLGKSRFKEAPESLLRERWNGGIAADDVASAARHTRGDFTGVLPGKTRKWKQLYGISFDWVLGECVGAGLVEVFDTGSIGRGVRAIQR
ncbi:hypothetical protein BP5796_10609 [Coleophoma crateriformis]|uniref:Serine-threonine protein kinase 19 n=1 Tax=Coleophoma crateriformis TaxID=565419 RepID=A0A3D8QQQ4_9HELO|nr:hypothetical protein BP5796_10609 [Coleophoma crateriformis]